ncbi:MULTISPECIES: hypothetical protein [Bradyrhizobium]
MQPAQEIHLVRVTTDDGVVQIWLAASSPGEALDEVLDVIPEGWTVQLVRRLDADQAAALNMTTGEIRRYRPL